MVIIKPPTVAEMKLARVSKTIVPTKPVTVAVRVKQAQQKFIKEETIKVDRLIRSEQDAIAEYSKQKAEYRRKYEGNPEMWDRKKFQSFDDNIADAKRIIRGYHQGKKYIKEGARMQDITSFAASKARAEIANIEAAQAARAAQIDFSKIEKGKITYDPRHDTYYTRDKTGKLQVTSGQRGYDFLATQIQTGGDFKVSRAEQIKLRGIDDMERFKEASKTFVPTTQSITGFGVSDPTIAQQRYIASLRPSPTAGEATITGYTGIQLPYGQKDVTWQEPAFGTITDETKTGFRDVSLYRTLREQERLDPDISKPVEIIYQEQADRIANKIIEEETKKAQIVLEDSVTKIQAKIDSGEMSVERGNEAIDRITTTANNKLISNVKIKFNKQLTAAQGTKAFKDKIKRVEKFRGTFARSFDPAVIRRRNLNRIETAVDITAAVVSGVIPGVGVAYFGAKGIYKGARGREKDVRMADYNPITGELITPRYMGEIPSEETREAGVSLLFAGMSGIAAAGKIGGEITVLRAAELKVKPWTITAKEVVQVGDDTVLKVSASKTIGTASAEAELILPIKINPETGAYKLLAGKGAVKTRVVDFMSQGAVARGGDIIKGSYKFNVFGRGAISDGVIQTKWGVIKLKGLGLKVTSGEGYISPNTIQNFRVETIAKRKWISPKPFTPLYKKQQVIKFDVATKADKFVFGGVSVEGKTGTSFVSGKLAKARLYPSEARFTGLFKPGAYGEVLKAGEKPVMKGFTGGTTKSSKQFFKQLYAQTPKVVTKTEVIGRQAIPSILSTAERGAIRTSLKTPSVIGRTALSTLPVVTERAGSLTIPAVGMSSTEMLKSRLGIKSGVDVGITSRSISQGLDVNPITGVKPITDVSISPMTAVKPMVTTRQVSRQIVKPIVGVPVVIPPVPIAPTIPTTPIVTPSPPLAFGFERKKGQVVKAQGYKTSVLRKSTQNGGWIQLATPPLTRESALSSGAREVDAEIGARFKIKKTADKISGVVDGIQKFSGKLGAAMAKKKPQVGVIDTKDKYFQNNRQKFRMWKQKKGRRKATPNQYIERQKYRLDSQQERRSIQAAKGKGRASISKVTLKKRTKSLFGL